MTHKIIAIGRQSGSGGREIGLATAQALGILCYDKELITLAVERGELDYDKLEKFDERRENPLFYEAVYDGNWNVPRGSSCASVLFQLQSGVIRQIAAQEDAVIIGRCANYVLRDAPDTRLLTVFLAAPLESRIQRKMDVEGMDRKSAQAFIRKTDKQRAQYYRANTGLPWGDPDGFDLYLDTSRQTREQTVAQIVSAYEALSA